MSLAAHSNGEAAVNPAVFRQLLKPISTEMGIPIPVVEAHIRANRARGLRRLTDHPEYGKWKEFAPIAIVGGGPSLRYTLDELRQHRVIVACGSVHDYLVDNGIIPTYAIACDPNPIVGEMASDFIRKPQHACEYLISSTCPPKVLDDLDGYDVTMWNMGGGVDPAVFGDELVIDGCCTVTLRAIPVMFHLGYQVMHFFGLDSSFEETDHAYPAGDHDLNKAVILRVGGENGREFRATWAWLAQAEQFQDILRENPTKIRAIVHGDGMIAEIYRQRNANAGVTE